MAQVEEEGRQWWSSDIISSFHSCKRTWCQLYCPNYLPSNHSSAAAAATAGKAKSSENGRREKFLTSETMSRAMRRGKTNPRS